YEQYKISYNELDQIISNLDHILTHSASLAPIQVCHQALNYLKQYKNYLVARDDKIITDSHSIVVRDPVDELQLSPILDALGEDIVYSLHSKHPPRKIIGLKNKQAVLDASPRLNINHEKRTIIGVSRIQLWKDLSFSLDADDFYCKHFPNLDKCHPAPTWNYVKPAHLGDFEELGDPNYHQEYKRHSAEMEVYNAKGYDRLDESQLALEILRLVFKERIDELFNELQQLGADKNPSYQRHALDKVQAQLDALVYLNTNDFMIYKSNMGNSAFAVSNLVNQLGVSVVLDATASINQYYQLANRYLGHVAWVDAPQIRQYTNLTIHIATGFNQSRASLYKAQASQVDENALSYLSHAIAELQPDDKLLIICHLDFKKVLQKNCQDKRIQFTHWGNHVGRNLWSDCNKVMLIGWNYLNPLEYISMIASALDSVLLTTRHLNDELVNEFSLSQLADDIVQGLMRSQARIIATPDSDCRPTDFYLFHKGDEESQKVIDLVLSQFPQAKVEDWQPKGQAVSVKKRKPQKKIDSIIELLQEKAKSHQTYLLNDLVDELGINKSTMSRIVNSDEFAERLSEQGYLLKQKDGKSKQFILN
ncbi:MAG TPA: helix-turn-helix domain-containing protein, partial [Thiotrichales bacterium]|nr:helix-turn-helix domain-containing protein [Thiotrichales bacterium]